MYALCKNIDDYPCAVSETPEASPIKKPPFVVR